jgi:hypothetical protein
MSWSGLASNEMVTFTNAQGGGFTLNPGQSSVTSNQCMTANDALTKYQLSSSAMSSYAGNQLVPKSVWVGVNYYLAFTQFRVVNTTTDICTISLNTSTYYTTNSNGILGIGDIIYVYDVGYYPIIGSGGFVYYTYLEGTSRVWVEINTTTGAIISKTYCTVAYSYEVRLGNSNAEACSAFTETVYSDSSIFAEGIVIYTTSALTTVVTGYTRVVDEAFNPYILDTTLGVVGSQIGSC